MADNHEYTIRIKREYQDGGTNGGWQVIPNTREPQQRPNIVKVVNGTEPKSSTSNVGIKVLALGVAKSYVQYGLSNVGKWTGNSHTQTLINNATEAVGLGILAKANPYAAVAAIAVKTGTTFLDGKFDNYMQGLKSTRALNRAGYSSMDEVIGVKH